MSNEAVWAAEFSDEIGIGQCLITKKCQILIFVGMVMLKGIVFG
jgi:hypothetical protein